MSLFVTVWTADHPPTNFQSSPAIIPITQGELPRVWGCHGNRGAVTMGTRTRNCLLVATDACQLDREIIRRKKAGAWKTESFNVWRHNAGDIRFEQTKKKKCMKNDWAAALRLKSARMWGGGEKSRKSCCHATLLWDEGWLLWGMVYYWPFGC